MENANAIEYHYPPALLAKERQLTSTLRALEAMLETVQELRTKVNFERNQLITLIEMAKAKSRGEQPSAYQPATTPRMDDSGNESRDPLVLLDKLYNGAYCVSEEEEEDDDDLEDDDIFTRGDNFGGDNVQW